MPVSEGTTSAGLHGFVRSWQALAEAAMATTRAANRAVLAPVEGSLAMTTGVESRPETHRPPTIPSLAYEREDWPFERSVDDVSSITVGDFVRFTKTITDADVAAFADVSGDTNRLHLDAEYAEHTRFGDRIAHGTLVSGLISSALARLPGLTIYISQTTDFLRPVPIDSTVTAIVEVVEDLGKGQYRLTTVVENESGEAVIDGEAVVLIDPVDG